MLERPFSGDAAGDAKALMASIRTGRIFTVIDAIAAPGFLGMESDGTRHASVVLESVMAAN